MEFRAGFGVWGFGAEGFGVEVCLPDLPPNSLGLEASLYSAIYKRAPEETSKKDP